MLKWNQSIVINAPIEKVWELFGKSNINRIMPQIVETTLISSDETTNTSIYKETYQEGAKRETYELTEIILIDRSEEKKKFFEFTIANMIHTEASFHLKKTTEDQTAFTYEGENSGASFIGKVMLKMASNDKNDKTVQNFMALVKREAEKE